MNRLIIAIIGILVCCSCSKKDDIEPIPEPVVQHTVLVYMSGENNLTKDSRYPNESYLADDLEEMKEGSYLLSKDQRLIAFIDSVGTNNYPHIVEIANGKATEVYRYDKEFYASDPQKFREIVKWTMDNYPSEDYALVLWGHATGWAVSNDTIASARKYTRAYGQDKGWDNSSNSSNSERWMNITQMAKALEGLPKFKYIFADCCCFMCVESAYELRNVADYLIGSPAEIPGEGGPYHILLPKLFSQSTTFYKDICDTYYDYFMEAYQMPPYIDNSSNSYFIGYSLPLSAIDLSKMDNLAQATNQVLKSFATNYPEELDLSYLPFYFGLDYPVMYDMKSVIQKYAPSLDYSQWISAYNKAVVYSLVSQRWMTIYSKIKNKYYTFPSDESVYGCVSMFFPQNDYDSSDSKFEYNTRIKNCQWYYAVDWSNYGW